MTNQDHGDVMRDLAQCARRRIRRLHSLATLPKAGLCPSSMSASRRAASVWPTDVVARADPPESGVAVLARGRRWGMLRMLVVEPSPAGATPPAGRRAGGRGS